jgi:hypothetical protein
MKLVLNNFKKRPRVKFGMQYKISDIFKNYNFYLKHFLI